MRKNCYSDWEKLLKFKAEGRKISKNLRPQEQFIWTAKDQKSFSVLIQILEQLEFKLGKKNEFRFLQEK